MDQPLSSLLKDVLRADVADILAAREKAKILHHTTNIRAAGDEVEMAVRDVLRRKLPVSYYVGQGHLVDERLHQSPQFDVVIADNTTMPIFFRSHNGTEYFPYEAVYAIGEVKTTYRKEHMEAFSTTLAALRAGLSRAPSIPWQQPASGPQPADFEVVNGVPVLHGRPYRNPLFSFMLFVSGEDFTEEHFQRLYASGSVQHLPNIVCFLDAGIVVNANVFGSHEAGRPLQINVIPEFNREGTGRLNGWVHARAQDEDQAAYGFGSLFYMLSTHLASCTLTPPKLLNYLRGLFDVRQDGTIVFPEDS